MKIYVTTTFEALHNWEGAPDGRKYLRHPHRHTFGVTAWADVSHPDRDIEFHDLKRKVDDVIGSILLGHYSRDESLPFLGTMSCEHIGREILEAVPELCAVEVNEDGEFGAYIEAENPVEEEQKYNVSFKVKSSFGTVGIFLYKEGDEVLAGDNFRAYYPKKDESRLTEQEIREFQNGDILFEHFAVKAEELEE